MRQLKKVVYALTKDKLQKNIDSHEKRGWVVATDVKKHGYGIAVQMIFKAKGEINHASNGQSTF